MLLWIYLTSILMSCFHLIRRGRNIISLMRLTDQECDPWLYDSLLYQLGIGYYDLIGQIGRLLQERREVNRIIRKKKAFKRLRARTKMRVRESCGVRVSSDAPRKTIWSALWPPVVLFGSAKFVDTVCTGSVLAAMLSALVLMAIMAKWFYNIDLLLVGGEPLEDQGNEKQPSEEPGVSTVDADLETVKNEKLKGRS